MLRVALPMVRGVIVIDIVERLAGRIDMGDVS